jgi:hypothetical protein
MTHASISQYDFLFAAIPVLVVTVLFSILIAARIYATSSPVNKLYQNIDPNGIGLDGLS